jgi:hypothetical protein
MGDSENGGIMKTMGLNTGRVQFSIWGTPIFGKLLICISARVVILSHTKIYQDDAVRKF